MKKLTTYTITQDGGNGLTATKGVVTRAVGSEIKGTVELPDNNGWLKIAGKDREYPDTRVALAIWAGQITLDRVSA